MNKKKFFIFLLTIIHINIFGNFVYSQQEKFDENDYIISKSSDTFDKQKFFRFDQKKWNKIRNRIEQNLPLYEEKVSTTTIPPVLTPTTIEFIEGTQLTISGRKLIGIQVKSVKYPEKKEYDRTDISMNQELQVAIRGKVGNNVDVNIDIDDTQPDKRDILILYRGEGVEAQPGAVGYKAKPGAFIQEAAFGDIQLSLPNTEFVGYSRQVFGLKVTAQYNQARLYLIASQSKGNFETKRFTGKTEFERKILFDTSYKRRKYYDLSFNGKYKPKRDTVEVYLDTLDPSRDPFTLKTLTGVGFNVSTFTYTGKFEKLALGRDYTVDYAKGIITFNIPNKIIQPNWVIVVNYVDYQTDSTLSSLLGTTNYIILKDKDETETINWELKNRYEIGRTNIVRDDSTGNFLLKITDKSNRILDPAVDKIQPGDKPVPVYQSVNAADIIVDFENGEFYFLSLKPFAEDCYYKTSISRYNILVEYRYRSKTYFLKPFIVPYSEQVTINGKLKQRNVDYWIDYDSGFITFLKEEEITETSIIEASYEYSMLGLQAGETIAGARLELPLASKLFVGSSWIGSIPSKGGNVPDVRSTPSSLNVWEADTRLVDFKIPLLPFKINSFSAEYAESEKNPNIWDKAIIENMEGITLEDNISTYKHMWYYSSCSDIYIPGTYDVGSDKIIGGELNWENEDLKSTDINPNKTTTVDKQQVLKINYNLYHSSEVAMVYQFSKIGLDFTKKLYIEAEIYSDAKGGQLYLDLGQLSEDIDQDGILDTEDKNKNGVLDLDEDTGFEYNLGNSKYYINTGNGKLDTEDLDGDNALNTVDKLAGSYKLADLDFNGWISTRVVVEVSNKILWSSVKHLRLRIKGHKKSGVIKIAKISVVGNKFEVLTSTTTKIYAVNNENDKEYQKLSELKDYSSIYGTQFEEKNFEQSLAIEYNFNATNSSSVVSLLYSRAINFTYHHKLNFFLFNKTANDVVFKFRAYTDNNNYFEYSTTTLKLPLNKWVKFTIDQVDLNYDNIPDEWDIKDDNNSSGLCKRIGNANLQAITKIEIIIENTSSLPQKGIIYVNDIYLSDSWKRKGIARKLELNMSIPGWINFGGKTRSVDRNFETFSSAITNQDNITNAGYLDFVKLKFVPMNFQGKQEQTITPSAIESGDLVSTIEEGKKIYTEGSFNTTINISKLPRLGFNYTKSLSSTTALARTDMKDGYWTTLSYTNPVSKYIPLESISVKYGEEKFLLYPWKINFSTYTINSNVDNTRNISVNFPFNFWNLLNLNLSLGTAHTFTELRIFNKKIDEDLIVPQLSNNDLWDYYNKLTFFSFYNLQKTYEIYYTSYSVVISSYEKRTEWNTDLNSTINILTFFKPNLGYKINVVEDYNYSASTRTKDVLRNATGSLGVSFMPKDVLNIKHIQSLRLYYNFSLTAADKYEKLPKDFPMIDFYNMRNLNLLWYKTDIATITVFRTKFFERKEQKLQSGWKFFEGIPFKGPVFFLSKTDLNLSYSDAIEEKEETQTKTYTYTKVWPDFTLSFYDIENIAEYIVKKQSVVKDTKLDINYTYRTTEVKKISFERTIRHKEMLSFSLFKEYQILSSYENIFSDVYSHILDLITSKSYTDIIGLQVGLPFFGQRLTPRYEYRKDYAEDSRKLPTKDLTTHTFAVSYYADIVPQQGINFFGKLLPLKNRLRINSTLQYVRKESPIDINKTNTDKISISSKLDYDISRYINISLSLGGDANVNRVVKTETNYSYFLGAEVIIRF